MAEATLEGLRAAQIRLLAAHDAWMRAFRIACKTLRYEDLVSVAERMDRAFREFLETSDSILVQIETARARMTLERSAIRREDLQIAQATFASLSKSVAALYPTHLNTGSRSY